MPTRDLVNLLSLAIEALQNGDLARARRACEECIRLDHSFAETFSVYGVVLAELGEREPATEAFRKAVMLSPLTPRFSYNLAAHQFALGDHRSARASVSEALKDDPDFQRAKTLLNRIDDQIEDGVAIEFDLPRVHRVVGESVVVGPSHQLGFMVGMERPWKMAGWAFVVLGVLAAVCVLVFQPFLQPEPIADSANLGFGLKNTAEAKATVFLLTISGVLSILWVLIDVVDRKQRLVWLVPTIACCSCGMHAAPQALYMLMRRD